MRQRARRGLFGQLETGVVRDRQRAGGGADVFFGGNFEIYRLLT